MEEIASVLQGALRQTVDRLRDTGGAVIFEDYPGALEESDQGDVGGDPVSASEARELSFTVRGLLVERANRLAEALDRLRSGEYGTCQACGRPIAPARLRAMPEVTTCVACQEEAEMTATRASHARGR
jgi:DnaK suppressor protein